MPLGFNLNTFREKRNSAKVARLAVSLKVQGWGLELGFGMKNLPKP